MSSQNAAPMRRLPLGTIIRPNSTTSSRSLLERIQSLDGTRHAPSYAGFLVGGRCVGQVLLRHIDMLLTCRSGEGSNGGSPCFEVEERTADGIAGPPALVLARDSVAERTAAMDAAARLLLDRSLIPRLHGDLFPVSAGWDQSCLCVVDRNAAPFFGVTSVGVHLNCFVRNEVDDGVKGLWMAQRSADKLNFPSRWDPTVAGGQPADMGLFDNLIKEAGEEAAIPPELVAAKASSVAALSQMTARRDGSCLKQSLYYVWDMEVESTFIPRATDGEVQQFELWSTDVLEHEVRRGERLRPAMRLVVTDFLIRHGVLTPDREPSLVRVQAAMHRDRLFLCPDTEKDD